MGFSLMFLCYKHKQKPNTEQAEKAGSSDLLSSGSQQRDVSRTWGFRMSPRVQENELNFMAPWNGDPFSCEFPNIFWGSLKTGRV